MVHISKIAKLHISEISTCNMQLGMKSFFAKHLHLGLLCEGPRTVNVFPWECSPVLFYGFHPKAGKNIVILLGFEELQLLLLCVILISLLAML